MAGVYEKVMPDVPQAVREIDVVPVRVFKPEHLGPERFELLGAALPDILERREIIDELTRAEHGDHHVFGAEVRERFALPRVFRMKDRERLRIVRRLVIQAEIVRKRLAVRAVVEAVKFLEYLKSSCL